MQVLDDLRQELRAGMLHATGDEEDRDPTHSLSMSSRYGA
jgi:hypothetical protein